jgi:hypothetical protein
LIDFNWEDYKNNRIEMQAKLVGEKAVKPAGEIINN